jgi:hypothetical protein
LGSIVIRWAVTLLVCATLASCASHDLKPGEQFTGVEAPEPGHARLYVFRPDFDSTFKRNVPNVLLNGHFVSTLPFKSFTTFLIRTGKQQVTLEPRFREPNVWRGAFEIQSTEGQVYFVAVWDRPDHLPPLVPLLQGIEVLMPIFAVVSTPRIGGHSLQIEMVSQSDALAYIRESRYVKAGRPKD